MGSDGAGIFQRRFALPPTGNVRAALVGSSQLSLPFSLAPVPDRVYTPFGQVPLEPPKNGR